MSRMGALGMAVMEGPKRWLSVAGAIALALSSLPAWAGVGYEVVIEAPAELEGRSLVRGAVAVQARAEDGLGDASFGAFHVRAEETPWMEAERVDMKQLEAGRFLGAARWNSARVSNGEYLLEVRIWGEVPAYDPENPNTFARSVILLLVDNPPEAPAVRAKTGGGSLRLTWRRARSSERDDFYGYRVWVAPGRECPRDPERYSLAGESTTTSWGATGLRPGRYCYRVTSTRTSPVTGIVDSPFSAPLSLRIPALGSGAPVLDAPRASAPSAQAAQPKVRSRKREGKFAETLPYAEPQIVAPAAEPPGIATVAAEEARRTSSEEAAHRAAAGLLLLALAIHLRRLLRAPSSR